MTRERTWSCLLGAWVITACGGSANERPLSVDQHVAAANDSDVEAAREEDVARSAGAEVTVTGCRDGDMSEVSTAGGVPIAPGFPCWSTLIGTRDVHRIHAEELRRDAMRHRRIAGNLLAVEGTACATVAPEQQTHTPTWHRDDIVRVVEIAKDGHPVGVHLDFRHVPGLTSAKLQKIYECMRARAAVVGFDPSFMSYCPAMLPHVKVAVVDSADAIDVSIVGDDAVAGALVWSRAQDLGRPLVMAP